MKKRMIALILLLSVLVGVLPFNSVSAAEDIPDNPSVQSESYPLEVSISENGLNASKCAEWTNSSNTAAEIMFNVNISEQNDPEVQNMPIDLIFIADISGSMEGDRILSLIDSLRQCTDTMISDESANRASLVTFSDKAKVSVPLTEDREAFQAQLGTMHPFGGTNYYTAMKTALEEVVIPTVEKEYAGSIDAYKSERYPVIIFLSDGLPNVDVEYNSLIYRKIEEMGIPVFGIQYMMGTSITDDFKEICGYSFNAPYCDALSQVTELVTQAVVSSNSKCRYENIVLKDYINEAYFTTDNSSGITLETNMGTAVLDGNCVTWDIGTLFSGVTATLTIQIALNSDDSGEYPYNLYLPTNEDGNESGRPAVINCTDPDGEEMSCNIATPYLPRFQHKVTYVSGIASGAEFIDGYYLPTEIVTVQHNGSGNNTPSYTVQGSSFRGWKVISGNGLVDQTYSPNDIFSMPDCDVTLEALWGDGNVSKLETVSSKSMLKGGICFGHPNNLIKAFSSPTSTMLVDKEVHLKDDAAKIVTYYSESVASAITCVEFRTNQYPFASDSSTDNTTILSQNYITEQGKTIVVDSVKDVNEEGYSSIKCWLEENTGGDTYTLVIASNGTKIYWNPNSSFLFCGLKNCTSFIGLSSDAGICDTSEVDDMSYLFAQCGNRLTSFSLGADFDTSNVTKMRCMFLRFGMDALNDISLDFDTSNVTDMCGMFAYLGNSSLVNEENSKKGFHLGQNFKTDNVTDMSFMFAFFGYNSLKHFVFPNLNTHSVTNMRYMFAQIGQMKLVTLDLNHLDTSNVRNMEYMFYFSGQKEMTEFSLGDRFYTSNVTNMRHMFHQTGQFALKKFDFPTSFNTSNVTNMSYMFFGFAQRFEGFDLSKCFFDTSNVIDMSHMFDSFGTEAYLSSFHLGYRFDTSNVENMEYMFSKFAFYSKLETLDLGNRFDTSNVYNMKMMFANMPQGLSIDFGHQFYVFSSNVYKNKASETNISGMFQRKFTNSIPLDLSGIKWNNELLEDGSAYAYSPANYSSVFLPNESLTGKIIIGNEYAWSESTEDGFFWLRDHLLTYSYITEVVFVEYKPCYTVSYTFDEAGLAAGFIAPKTEYASSGDTIFVMEPKKIPDGYRFIQWVPVQVTIGDTSYELTKSSEQDNVYLYTIDGTTHSVTINPEVGTTFEIQGMSILFEGQWSRNASEPTSVQNETSVVEPPYSEEVYDVDNTVVKSKNRTGIIHCGEVKEGETINYFISALYEGTEGARSNTIFVQDTIPEKLTVLDISEGVVSRLEADGGATHGFIVPGSINYDKDTRVLSFQVSDLSAGAKIGITVRCSVDPLEEGELHRDYYNTAYAYEVLEGNRTIKQSDTIYHYITSPTTSYSVSYKFVDGPIGIFPPAMQNHKDGETVSICDVSGNIPSGYSFEGWEPYSIMIDGTEYSLSASENDGEYYYCVGDVTHSLILATTPGETFIMPKADILFIGKWKIDEELLALVSVGYAYDGTVPEGAPVLSDSYASQVAGSDFFLKKMPHEVCSNGVTYRFSGWEKLLVEFGNDTQEITLNEDIFEFSLLGKTYQISMMGQLFNTAGYPDGTKLTFIGQWGAAAHKVSYKFVANDEFGNIPSDALMQMLTANGNLPIDNNSYFTRDVVDVSIPLNTVVAFEGELWFFDGWTSNDVIFNNGYSATSSDEIDLYFVMPDKDVTLTGYWSKTSRLQDDSVILDYGKPILLDIFRNDSIPSGYSAKVIGFGENADKEYSGVNGIFSIIDESVVYTPQTILTTVERTTVCVELTQDGLDGGVTQGIRVYESVKIIPATSVYYESDFSSQGISFISEDNDRISDGIERTAWTVVGEPEETHYQDDGSVGNGQTYGFDSSYQNDNMFSNGSSFFVEGQGWSSDDTRPSSKKYYTTAEFSFTGTGFEIISLTNDYQSIIFIEIYSGTGEDKQYINTAKVLCSGKDIGDTGEEGPTLYQIPVARIEDLPYGSYTILLGVGSSVSFGGTIIYDDDFHFDAIRIFDPILPIQNEEASLVLPLNEDQADAYSAYSEDGELPIIRSKVRDLLLKANEYHPDQMDNSYGVGLVTFIEDNYGTDQPGVEIADYQSRGPNNEVYLVYGQGIAFATILPDNLTSLDVGLKCAYDENAEYEIVLYADNLNASDSECLIEVSKCGGTLSSCTDQKIAVPLPQGISGKVYIVIRNATMDDNDKGILSITDIRLSCGDVQNASSGETKFIFDSTVLTAAEQCFSKTPVPGDTEIRDIRFKSEQCTVLSSNTLTVITSTDVRTLLVQDSLGNILDVPVSYYDTNSGERIWSMDVLIMMVGNLNFKVVAYCLRNEFSSEGEISIISVPYATEKPLIVN